MILEYSLTFLSILLGTECFPRYKDKYEQIITYSHSYRKRTSKSYEHKTAITQPSLYFDVSKTKRDAFYENVEVPERYIMRKVSKLTPPSTRSTRENKFYFWDTRLTFLQWSFRTTTQLSHTIPKYLYEDPPKILTRAVIPIPAYPFIRQLQEGLDYAKTYMGQDDPIASNEQQTTITSLSEIRPTQSSIDEEQLQTKDVQELQKPDETKDTADSNDIETSALIALPHSVDSDHTVTIEINDDKTSSPTKDYKEHTERTDLADNKIFIESQPTEPNNPTYYNNVLTESHDPEGDHSVAPDIHKNTTLAKDLFESDDQKDYHSNATGIKESTTIVEKNLPKSDDQKGDYSVETNTKEKIATTVIKLPELNDQKDDHGVTTEEVRTYNVNEVTEPDGPKNNIKLPELNDQKDDHSITTKDDRTYNVNEVTEPDGPKLDQSVVIATTEDKTSVVNELTVQHQKDNHSIIKATKDDHSVTTATKDDKMSAVNELTEPRDPKDDHSITTATKDYKKLVVSELTKQDGTKDDHSVTTEGITTINVNDHPEPDNQKHGQPLFVTTTIATVSITSVVSGEHDITTSTDMQTTTQMTADLSLVVTDTRVTATTPATKSRVWGFRNIVPYLLSMLISILISVALAYFLCNIFKTRAQRTEWKKVGTLRDIYVYPVKSCAPMALSEAKCTAQGLKNGWLRDRFLMIVNDKNNFISAKHYPELLGVYPCLRESNLVLKYSSMEFLQVDLAKVVEQKNRKSTYVWGVSVPVLDCGREASEWLSRILVKHSGTYRLVYCPAKNNSKTRNITNKIYKFAKNDTAASSYQTAYSILNHASVNALNVHTDCQTVSVLNFRPNFVVTGPQAKDEDNWAFVKIGRNVFEVAMSSRSNCKLKEIQLCEVDSVQCVGLQMGLTGSSGSIVARNDPVSVVYCTGDNSPHQNISNHDNDLTCHTCKRPVTKVIRNGKYVYTCRNMRHSNGKGECSQGSLCHHTYATAWDM